MNDLKVSSQFRTERHPGLAIVWEFGSNKLHLMRVGGPRGSYKIQSKTSSTYKDGAGALRGAERWFKLLDKIYRAETVDDEEVVSEDV